MLPIRGMRGGLQPQPRRAFLGLLYYNLRTGLCLAVLIVLYLVFLYRNHQRIFTTVTESSTVIPIFVSTDPPGTPTQPTTAAPTTLLLPPPTISTQTPATSEDTPSPPIDTFSRLPIFTDPLQDFAREKYPSNNVGHTNYLVDLYHDVPEAKDLEHVNYISNATWLSSSAKSVFLRYINFATIEISKSGEASPPRVVVVRPMGQLCNRLMSITSAFVFALLTRRALLIDDSGFYASMDDLFEKPGFPWLLNINMVEEGTLLTNPDYGDWDHAQHLLCSNYEMTYTTPIVTVSMNQYFVPYIMRNSNYGPSLRNLFGDDVFYPIAHFLYRPIKKLRDMLDIFLRDHDFKNNFVVGLQVRSGPDFTSNFMKAKAWRLYRACAEKVTPQGLRGTLKFFVATDTEEGREVAVKYLGAENVLFGPTRFLRSNNPEGVQMALLDLLILASAKDRVTTAWSSYGYFAAGYAGVAPNMVTDLPDRVPKDVKPVTSGDVLYMGIPHKSDRREQCVRLKNSQPCFHKFAVWGAMHVTCAIPKLWAEEEMRGNRYC